MFYSLTKHLFICAALSFILMLFSCRQTPALFKNISSESSGINFVNTVIENDSINPIDLEFLYNGGGVAVGDFDNDGLADLYFTASTTSNKLYLNRDNFSFEDVTETAHVTGEGRWANAASVVDINNDGWKDIYICNTLKKNPQQRKNTLYINQGLNANKIPVFKEMADEYNLADTNHSVHAGFFDFDNDGDLDVYIATTKLAGRSSAQFSSNNNDTIKKDIDKLYRNDWSDSLKHPVFTDISKQAGINEVGFALGLVIADLNRDGWKDVYVTNDFFTSDHAYINNGDGTFTNKAKEYFKHTSRNAMGVDIADFNNDGLEDVLSVDMNPEDNYRKKKNMAGNNYFIHQNMLYGEFSFQYVRNTLQLNQGPRLNGNDSIGDPAFSEISFLSGVSETDWSWNASIADFDNDGYRDIIITNGYPRDVTDHDFAAYRRISAPYVSKQELIDEIPKIKIPNYAFHNTGTLKFNNVTKEWGLGEPSFSNGAVYVDLDNDGDLDYVINNINEKAMVFENTVNTKEQKNTNYLQVKFNGDTGNRNGLGAFAQIYYDTNKTQLYENSPYRGYLSTVNDIGHFGLGKTTKIDSLVIFWPNGKKQLIHHPAINQLLTVNIKNAAISYSIHAPAIASNNLFTDVTAANGITYKHSETDIIDFDKERLIPHKLSQYGPGIAAGDIDGDGLDDLILGGNDMLSPNLLLQQKDGKFIDKILPDPQGKDVRKPENMGLLLFDADNDNDLDLYMASGSNEFLKDTKNYQDRLYKNDGKGNYALDENALPINYTSKSCVKAADFDNDGDLDLFVGGRILPGNYPMPVNSFIYRNDSKNGTLQFTDVTKQVAPTLLNIGLMCDALWTDFDNDGWTDLVAVGEWMPIRFFKNKAGKLEEVTNSSGIDTEKGWWNSIAGGDFDNDGDIDYIAGNLGENSFYRASQKYPVSVYAKDFDNNQALDAIITVYLKDEQNNLKEFPAQSRDDINSQLPGVKKQFLTYKEFGKAGLDKIFSKSQLEGALHLTATNFKSSFIKNMGNGKFEIYPLPAQAQFAPVYGIVSDDYNNDGNLDVALTGNDYGTEVTTGRYDALNGLLLLGNGKGNFSPQTILQSGLFVPGDGKALVKLRDANNNYLLAASQNNGPLKVFKSKQPAQLLPLLPGDQFAIIHFKNGQKRKEEFYYGTSFLSQSSRFLKLGTEVNKVEINNANKLRTINLP
jgi:hypothetical protein